MAVHNFKEPLPEEGLAHLSHKNFSNKTFKQVRWVRKMYREWRSYRNSRGLAFISCDLEDKATISADSLKFALCRFITEVKKMMAKTFQGRCCTTWLCVFSSTLSALDLVLRSLMTQHSKT